MEMLDDLCHISQAQEVILIDLTARYLEFSSIFIVYGRETRLLGD